MISEERFVWALEKLQSKLGGELAATKARLDVFTKRAARLEADVAALKAQVAEKVTP
jgi:hypothetical protein